MFKFNKFGYDQKVIYVGSKWTNDIGSKQGWIVGKVSNEDSRYVVEFGDSSYVMHEDVLAPFVTSYKDSGPEIRQIRKRLSDEEV